MTQLTDHFTLEELTHSSVGERRGINNTPSSEAILQNLKRVAETLEEVRALLGYNQIMVHSGYRSGMINQLVGGSRTSAHLRGLAADIVCPGYGSPLSVARAIQKSTIQYDQLILEYGWVHLGISAVEEKPRLMLL